MFDKSLFKTTEIVSRELDFPNGKATLYFRTLTSSENGVMADALRNRGCSDRAESLAWIIKQSICNQDGTQVNDEGKPITTLEEIKRLKEEPFQQLLNVVFEINKPTVGK